MKRIRIGSNNAIFMIGFLFLSFHTRPAFATTLQCDLTVIIGSNHICDVDKATFCQRVLDIDLVSKKILIIPSKSTSKIVEPVIDSWNDRFIRFSYWIRRGEKSQNSPGYVVILVSELNRLTGAYEEWEEYRHETGLRYSTEELKNLIADKTMGFFSAQPPTTKKGICSAQKPIL